jgi:hypothetical protein
LVYPTGHSGAQLLEGTEFGEKTIFPENLGPGPIAGLNHSPQGHRGTEKSKKERSEKERMDALVYYFGVKSRGASKLAFSVSLCLCGSLLDG